jgi:hypothetical protein
MTAGLLTLLAGRVAMLEKWISFLARVDLPWPTSLYVVDNSGDEAFSRRVTTQLQTVAHRFTKVDYVRVGRAFELCPSEPYIQSGKHAHVSTLYNQALARIQENLLITIEDDVEPAPDVLRRLNSELKDTAGCVAAAYAAPNAPDFPCQIPIEGRRLTLSELGTNLIRSVFVGGGCTIWKHELVRALLPIPFEYNSANPKEPKAMGWDFVLCRRLRDLGYDVLLAGGVRANHHVGGNVAKLNIITGFHRSGTSCVAGMLFQAGLPMGPEGMMMPPTQANQKGYYEHLEYVELNQSILKSPWTTELPKDVSPGIARRMGNAPSEITVKDPRFCLTLGYWRKYRNVQKVVIVLRSPEECVESLRIRKDKPQSNDFRWYYDFYLSNLWRLLGNKFTWCAIEFDEVCRNPRGTLLRLQEYLECPLVIDRGTQFVDSTLRHNRSTKSKYPDVCRKFLKYSR